MPALYRIVALPALLLTALAGVARADDIARNERIEVKEVKKNGEVVGLKLKLTLRPGRPPSYLLARTGIAPAGVRAADHRKAASDMSAGHLLFQFPDEKLQANTPKQVEYTVLYKDAPKLKPGMGFEVVTAFNEPNPSKTWHVWGMTGSNGSAMPSVFVAPGKPASRRTSMVSQIKRSGRRVGSRHKSSARARRLAQPKVKRPVRAGPRR